VLQNAKGPVLDVGCGSGYKTVRLEGYIPEGVELHGVDTNPLYGTMWESLDTRAKFHLVKVGEALPFVDCNFDIVIMSLMLHHIPLQVAEAFLSELSRVLCVGGKLVIEEQICKGTMQDVMEPLWDESQGCLEAYLSAQAFLPKLGFTLHQQELFSEEYRYHTGQGVVDDIMDCNPQLWDLPDLGERARKVRHVFERVKEPYNSNGFPYVLRMPTRFEVWSKSSAAPAPLHQLRLQGLAGRPAVALQKRMFTPGSEYLSPEVAPPRPPFPLCMEVCPGAEAELKEHGAEMRKLLNSRLHEVGAVLFQGLPLSGTKDFDELIGSLGWELFGEYKGGTAIRKISSEASMEASAEPFNFTIEPHQELSYSSAFPAKFALYCEREASLNSGCETVITDFRQVTDKLDKAFFHGAKAMGFKYALRMSCERTNPAAHYPFFWQRQIYDSKEATEMWLNRKGYTWSWEADGTLVMEIVLPSVRTHPITGEDIFFAQPHCFSASYSVAHPILMLDFVNEWSRAPDDLPFRISYGDGSAVSDETINHVRKTIYDCSVAFAMRSGDLLMLDNMLAGHGRMSGKTGSGRKMMSALLQPMGSD